MRKKTLLFLTGTRADFGKLKSLIKISQDACEFDVHIFVTGMHMNSKYGKTVNEVYKSGFKNIYPFINHDEINHMDRTLAKTIDGFSHYVAEIQPDLIVVHGDRAEALAGAIVGSLNNILVAHIEGGEVSGTIDELIRHAVSKLSHIHLVGNTKAKKRLIQLGEKESNIFIIGSPDLDLMNPRTLPSIEEVKAYYEISFDSYAIVMFHPVTTEYAQIRQHVTSMIEAMLASNKNYIIIYPNNDLGSEKILQAYETLKKNKRIKIFPSLRFEYFLRLLEQSDFLLGNSSTSIHEAPYYNIPCIDIGSRQSNRSKHQNVLHVEYNSAEILDAIYNLPKPNAKPYDFGDGTSASMFLNLLQSDSLWKIEQQKTFQDIN